MSTGRKLTDKELEKLEKKLAKEYRTAKKDMQKKLDKFKKKFDAADKAQKGLLDKGIITKKQYKEWRAGQIARSQWMQEQIKSYANDLVNTNRRAAEMINGVLPGVFAENHGFGTYEVERTLGINTSYTFRNRDTIVRLLKDDPQLLPKASIDIPKDQRWNVQKLNSALTQGLMQGESIDKIADRLQNVADMNRASAIRNARTMVTGAENAGKLESYRRAAAMGIKIKKTWSATMDDRTRDSHAFLDGVTVELEQEFPNGCMYPGDPGGPGDEVWNCRCELSMQMDGFERDATDLSQRNTDHFTFDDYETWKKWHTERLITTTNKRAVKELKEGGHVSDRTIQYMVRGGGTKRGIVARTINVSEDMADVYVDHAEIWSGYGYKATRAYQQGIARAYQAELGAASDEFLEELIEKSPKWKGGVTYRGVRLDENQLNELKSIAGTNKIYDMKGTAAWSSDRSVALERVKTHTDVIFECETQSKGISIAHISVTPYEYEVLTSKRARYTIISVKQDRNGVWVVKLKEKKR